MRGNRSKRLKLKTGLASAGPVYTGFVLSNQFFKDYTVDLPVGTANAVIRFESNYHFPKRNHCVGRCPCRSQSRGDYR